MSSVALALAMAVLAAKPAQANPTGCTQVQFIGLRGSGETRKAEEHKMGTPVFKVYDQLAKAVQDDGISVTPDGLGWDYVAAPVPVMLTEQLVLKFELSVPLGVNALTSAMKEQSGCVVLAGYSQGAWVIDDYLADHPEVAESVIGVVLLGDPGFDGGSEVAAGDAGSEAEGILRHSILPANVRMTGDYYSGMSGTVRSYCAKGDPVCDSLGSSPQIVDDCLHLRPPCVHFKYPDNGDVTAAADFLTDRLRTKTFPTAPVAVPVGTPAPSPLMISNPSTYTEGDLVYARINYDDPTGIAIGFGFQGVWGQETHPFTDPSFGRVYPGRVDYPFNLGCDHGGRGETDIQMWIYGDDDITSEPAKIHLACGGSHPG